MLIIAIILVAFILVEYAKTHCSYVCYIILYVNTLRKVKIVACVLQLVIYILINYNLYSLWLYMIIVL